MKLRAVNTVGPRKVEKVTARRAPIMLCLRRRETRTERNYRIRGLRTRSYRKCELVREHNSKKQQQKNKQAKTKKKTIGGRADIDLCKFHFYGKVLFSDNRWVNLLCKMLLLAGIFSPPSATLVILASFACRVRF